MSTPSSRKRPAAEDVGDLDGKARVARPATKRRRSHSVSSTEHLTQFDLDNPTRLNRPASGSSYDLDRLNDHVRLQDFGVELQKAVNAVFPTGQISRYTKVDVILLSWEDEESDTKVLSEIQELADTFANLFGYHVEEWLIPAEDSHNKLQVKILQFLWESNPNHLKVVYYAGHARSASNGQPVLTSRRNSQKERCPTVKWAAIQNSLEESRSDVLILLDCCASGVCTTNEGNGVTEMIAAWACEALSTSLDCASFTQALNSKLKLLSQLPYFTVGQLYNAIFTEVQGWRVEPSALRPKKLPVHLVLTRFQDSPRSICLSRHSKISQQQDIKQTLDISNPIPGPQPATSSVIASPSPEPETPTPASLLSPNASAPSSATSLAELPEYPRLLFSIRLSEDVKPSELSSDIFVDWLKKVPIKANLVRVEAGFTSDSTLVMFSISPAILGYLPENPAMTLLGTIKSKNIMSTLGPPGMEGQATAISSSSEKSEPNMQPPITPISPPTASPVQKEEPLQPKGGCRYIMFREDIRPMTCACQGYSQNITTPNVRALCDCGHKPCYHLASRNQTVYRQELEALTKKVYSMEHDLKRIRLRNSGMPTRAFGEDREMMPPSYRGKNPSERPLVMQDRGSYLVPGQPGPELWNFRGS